MSPATAQLSLFGQIRAITYLTKLVRCFPGSVLGPRVVNSGLFALLFGSVAIGRSANNQCFSYSVMKVKAPNSAYSRLPDCWVMRTSGRSCGRNGRNELAAGYSMLQTANQDTGYIGTNRKRTGIGCIGRWLEF